MDKVNTDKQRTSKIEKEGLKKISLVCHEMYENTILMKRRESWVINSVNIKYTHLVII